MSDKLFAEFSKDKVVAAECLYSVMRITKGRLVARVVKLKS